MFGEGLEFMTKMTWMVMIHVAWIPPKVNVLDFPHTQNQGNKEKAKYSIFCFSYYVLNYAYYLKSFCNLIFNMKYLGTAEQLSNIQYISYSHKSFFYHIQIT